MILLFLLCISSGISLGSLDESHICLVSQTWKFGEDKVAARMICNMIANLPSLLFTLPEHRGKGYAKVLVSNMAKRLHTQVYPVYCFIKEENVVSYSLFKYLGFTEDPSYRKAWVGFKDFLGI